MGLFDSTGVFQRGILKNFEFSQEISYALRLAIPDNSADGGGGGLLILCCLLLLGSCGVDILLDVAHLQNAMLMSMAFWSAVG
jgi:hypothetical protein